MVPSEELYASCEVEGRRLPDRPDEEKTSSICMGLMAKALTRGETCDAATSEWLMAVVSAALMSSAFGSFDISGVATDTAGEAAGARGLSSRASVSDDVEEAEDIAGGRTELFE